MADGNGNGNGNKRRRIDRETMERAAENSVVKLFSRFAWVIILSLGSYFGHRIMTQLDMLPTLATNVAVIAVEVKGLDRRVRNLEWTGRRTDDDRPGVRQ